MFNIILILRLIRKILIIQIYETNYAIYILIKYDSLFLIIKYSFFLIFRSKFFMIHYYLEIERKD